MSDNKDVNKIDELVEEAKKPGTFNILNVLKDGGLPRDTVAIILDNKNAYKASKIRERIEELMASDVENINDEVKDLQEQLDALVADLNANRYTVHVAGITEGERDKLAKLALDKFPQEYQETKNPLTGEVTRKELDSPEREEYFTNLLWVASIEKIVSPDGDEQNVSDLEFVEEFRKLISIPTNAAITQAIEKLRVATAVFIMSTDEDFLAKP